MSVVEGGIMSLAGDEGAVFSASWGWPRGFGEGCESRRRLVRGVVGW